MRRLLLAAASVAAMMCAGQPAAAGPVTQVLYFTTFNGGGKDVWKSTVSYNGNGTAGNGSFVAGASTNLAITPGADGIVFNPNNQMLLVGGQATGKVYQVNPAGGNSWTTLNAGAPVYEITVDPSKNTLWGASSESGGHTISALPINPTGGAPTVTTVHGADNTITHIAFGPGLTQGTAFYTSSGDAGGGNFGIVNLSTGLTTALISGALYAHGMVYDPFTGDLILAGGNELAQIDPVTHAVISTVFFRGSQFDQGAVDGKGHLYWADNGGHLLFIDYSNTMLIGSAADFTSDPMLMAKLDDLAPLVGTGSHNPGVPEPLSLALFGGALGIFGALRRRRTRTAA